MQGSAPYITTGIGTAELQRRAFQTVYNKEGSPIGFVMVSASVATIQRKKLELLRSFLLVFAPALGSSWLLARSVRDALLGHEPGTFAQMYLQREEVLDHLSECLLAVAPDGRLLFANAQAKKLLPEPKLPADFPLWREVPEEC